MTPTWAFTIAANLALLFLLWRRRSRHLTLWASQTLVIAATLILVPAWYLATEETYNTLWLWLHLAQLVLEMILMASIFRRTNYLRDALPCEFAAVVGLLMKLDTELQSYWAWDPFQYREGERLMHVAQWINLFVIAMLCVMVYKRKDATASGEHHELHQLQDA